jgi:agmatine deiminase
LCGIDQREEVWINVADEAMQAFAVGHWNWRVSIWTKVRFFFHPTNDAWCRDHGPAFLINPAMRQKKR